MQHHLCRLSEASAITITTISIQRHQNQISILKGLNGASHVHEHYHSKRDGQKNKEKLECGPMSNVMVALPNTGGALCSTPQSLADAHY